MEAVSKQLEALNGEVAEIRDKREELQERMEKETEASKIHNLQKRIGDLSTDKEKLDQRREDLEKYLQGMQSLGIVKMIPSWPLRG